MAVGNNLKRSSSFDDCVTMTEDGIHYTKKAREANVDVSAASPKNNERKEKLSVRFSSENEVFEITRPTQEEKLDMHMSKEDQKLIIQEISDAIHNVHKDNMYSQNLADDSDNKFIQELGIQRILQQQEAARIDRVKSAIFVILQRQRQAKLFRRSKLFYSAQESTQVISESWLEKHYRPFSKVSSELARSRGLEDQETAPYLFPRKIVMVR